MDFAWNLNDANRVREATDRAMRDNADNMHRAAKRLLEMATRLYEEAERLERLPTITTSETRTRVVTLPDGTTKTEEYTEWVTDYSAMAIRAERIEKLKKDAEELRYKARNLSEEAYELDRATRRANELFQDLFRKAQETDGRYAGYINDIKNQITGYIDRIQELRDSIGVISPGGNASRGAVLMNPDSFAPAWAGIQNILSRPASDITVSEYGILAHFFIMTACDIPATERFLNYLARPLDFTVYNPRGPGIGVWGDQYTPWTGLSPDQMIFGFDSEIVGNIKAVIDVSIALWLDVHVELLWGNEISLNDPICEALTRDRRTMQERSALLSEVLRLPNGSTFTHGPTTGYTPTQLTLPIVPSMSDRMGVLVGGANGPFRLEPRDNGISLFVDTIVIEQKDAARMRGLSDNAVREGTDIQSRRICITNVIYGGMAYHGHVFEADGQLAAQLRSIHEGIGSESGLDSPVGTFFMSAGTGASIVGLVAAVKTLGVSALVTTAATTLFSASGATLNTSRHNDTVQHGQNEALRVFDETVESILTLQTLGRMREFNRYLHMDSIFITSVDANTEGVISPSDTEMFRVLNWLTPDSKRALDVFNDILNTDVTWEEFQQRPHDIFEVYNFRFHDPHIIERFTPQVLTRMKYDLEVGTRLENLLPIPEVVTTEVVTPPLRIPQPLPGDPTVPTILPDGNYIDAGDRCDEPPRTVAPPPPPPPPPGDHPGADTPLV